MLSVEILPVRNTHASVHNFGKTTCRKLAVINNPGWCWRDSK